MFLVVQNSWNFSFSLPCKACITSPFLDMQSLQNFFIFCCVEFKEFFYVLPSKLTSFFIVISCCAKLIKLFFFSSYRACRISPFLTM